MGDSHWNAHPEALVIQARAMRAQGMTVRSIAKRLGNGISHTTVSRWATLVSRKPPVRVIARRSKPEQSAVNHQQAHKNPSTPSNDGPAVE